MNAEVLRKAAERLMAAADGKKLEGTSARGWVPLMFDASQYPVVTLGGDTIRIAPDLPPKPSQEWLDKLGIELLYGPMSHLDAQRCHPDAITIWVSGADEWFFTETPARDCWKAVIPATVYVVRKRTTQVRPWTLATVPMPLVVRPKNGGSINCGFGGFELGVWIGCSGGVMQVFWDELLANYEQRDGSPCGEVVP